MTNTKHIVMSRVRAIHALRPFVSTGMLYFALIVASAYAISREVWVEMVLRNMPDVTNFGALLNFFTHAFLHTGVLVQTFSIVALASAFFLVREFFRAVPALAFPRVS